MAPYRGRGSRGAPRGSSRGGRGGGRLARSGIRTRGGYKKFDSQRTKDVHDSEDEQPLAEASESDSADGADGAEQDLSEEDVEAVAPAVKSYSALLQSFTEPRADGEPKAKRRRIQEVIDPEVHEEELEVDEVLVGGSEDEQENGNLEEEVAEASDDADDSDDPFETHFAKPDDNELSRRLQAIQAGDVRTEKSDLGKHIGITMSFPSCAKPTFRRHEVRSTADLSLKERLSKNVASKFKAICPSHVEQATASHMFEYRDMLVAHRTHRNAESLRRMASLHAVNHILKGRDRVLKNNERLSHADRHADLDCRDQGFVRPKVLILLETRQMAAKYADAIVQAFQPEQQENRKRFDDSFTAPLDERETMPEDYRELFGGNNDNSFLTALKFTRKTLKFYSAFYNSDIILASPLGLRRIIENEDARKRDHDFLSSIELLIADQVDAMAMQNWDNVEIVFNHLNLELKEAHGCDFSRVRNYYLDGNARYMRQTILFTAYITPETNRIYNSHMLNIAGKVKLTPIYQDGAITSTSGVGIKQTFSRFDSPSPLTDPDARFKYFTTAILPQLLRLPRPVDGAQGILIFVPSYFDFLRLRNYFATSDQTANISFGTIHDYTEVSAQRRARSHFLSGRHSFLLYTQRAHHFFRLKIRGVKRAVMYGLPDNPVFYEEIVGGYLGGSVQEGRADAKEVGVRCAFSRWDGLRLERVVGSTRVKGLLGGMGDTFDFV